MILSSKFLLFLEKLEPLQNAGAHVSGTQGKSPQKTLHTPEN